MPTDKGGRDMERVEREREREKFSTQRNQQMREIQQQCVGKSESESKSKSKSKIGFLDREGLQVRLTMAPIVRGVGTSLRKTPIRKRTVKC